MGTRADTGSITYPYSESPYLKYNEMTGLSVKMVLHTWESKEIQVLWEMKDRL